ncbi:SIMPL domain-containing protein [Parasalinivibrio latis]|uniref:SIMPL domain-containing protein n=1 Tax=Parasalinivibrio latis TaxID=2952610 RepID=UPI0030E26102
MEKKSIASAGLLGGLVGAGLVLLGVVLGGTALDIKEYERTVTVKGLSEQEYPADIVIWPIQFAGADNNLEKLYDTLDESTQKIDAFLVKNGIPAGDISVSSPSVTDKSAQSWGDDNVTFRFSGQQTVTVYSKDIKAVRAVMGKLSELGKQGIVFTGGYEYQTEYLFTRLNEIKPAMVEEATRNAREVARKFAEDSDSKLGKIKRASQGQFVITARDKNNPHIKKVRVVSTVEYYLSD